MRSTPPSRASLGASGAVFGLLGAFFVVNRKFGRDNSGLLVLVGDQPGASAFLPGRNIDWHAHVGGLITGALVAAAMVYAPRSGRTVVQVGGLRRRTAGRSSRSSPGAPPPLT